MGKDLRGKELGVGISQRKDGIYMARFTDRIGKRRQQYFKKLQKCRQWLAGARFEDEHASINAFGNMTVKTWFHYWIKNVKNANVKKNTIESYMNRFKNNIEPYIGNMLLKEIKPLHCQNILNQMVMSNYKNSTIGMIRTAMKILFDDAVDNEIIVRNPVTKTVKCTQGKESAVKTAITIDEQKIFLEFAKSSSYYNQYAFILQTGIRVGEMIGLRWSDVDFENKVLHISRTANQISGNWVVSAPKSKSGVRDIPLTNEAITILNEVKRREIFNVIPIQCQDIIFVSRNGRPIDNSSYNAALKKICEKAGISHISMHTLRHTFATRCIEAGMQPKTLQSILGHSSIDVTMDIYVHVMENTKSEEMKKVESALKVI